MEFQNNRPAQGALRENHSSNIFISVKYTNKCTKSPMHILKYFCSMDTKWIEPLQMIPVLMPQLKSVGSSAELC